MKPTELLHTIEFAGLVLAIVALGVGVYHVIEIRKALANLANVQNSLSTQYLGKFPYFLSKIVELIDSARHELVVFCDFPGYADLTEPIKALEYRQALERKAQSTETHLEVTCLDSASRLKYLNDQFSGPAWANWSDTPDRQKVIDFLHLHSTIADPAKASIDEIIATMQAADEELLRKPLFRAALQVPLHMPIYFWIADGQRAIFAVPALSDDAVEYGFFTSDHALIQALLDMHRRYRKASTPPSPKREAVAAAHQPS